VPYLFALPELLGHSKFQIDQGCDGRPSGPLSCLSGKSICPLISGRPGVSFNPGNLGGLILEGEVGE
jgi:hypothetical protein